MTHILAIYYLLQKDQKDNNNIILNPVFIDRSHPWAFFDRASQGDRRGCGGGFVFHLSETP